MDKNKALLLASVIFGIVALLHLLRAVLKLPVSIAGWNVPSWLSYVALYVAGLLAWIMYKAGRK